jgi:hypothetical protein
VWSKWRGCESRWRDWGLGMGRYLSTSLCLYLVLGGRGLNVEL